MLVLVCEGQIADEIRVRDDDRKGHAHAQAVVARLDQVRDLGGEFFENRDKRRVHLVLLVVEGGIALLQFRVAVL